MNILLKATISDLLLIVGGTSMLLVPVSALIWLIRKLMKKSTKGNMIWTIVFAVSFIVLESVGISMQCDHAYQLTQTIPPTNSGMGQNTYICKLCGNEKVTAIDQLTYYSGATDPTSSNLTNIESDITGVWKCGSTNSYDGTSIVLTITQQNDALIFERNASNSSDGVEANVVFIVNEFNESSAYYKDTNVTYLRVDDLLYEVTASDDVNIFTFDGQVDLATNTPSSSPDHTSSTSNKSSSYSAAPSRKRAMTAEEADKLRGTGYHGTRPNSSAESSELRAAQVTCKECGYHSDNGANSLCDYCRWKQQNSN